MRVDQAGFNLRVRRGLCCKAHGDGPRLQLHATTSYSILLLSLLLSPLPSLLLSLPLSILLSLPERCRKKTRPACFLLRYFLVGSTTFLGETAASKMAEETTLNTTEQNPG